MLSLFKSKKTQELEARLAVLTAERDLAQNLSKRLEGEIKEEKRQNRRLLVEERIQRSFRNVAWPKPAVRMPAHAVLKEFNVPLDKGLPAALHQELDDSIADLLDVVSQPPSATLNEDQRLHIAGGVEHLRLFQKHLLDLAARASTGDPDLEEDEKDKPAA